MSEVEQYQCHNCGEDSYDVIGGDGEEVGKCSNPECFVIRFEASEKWYNNE